MDYNQLINSLAAAFGDYHSVGPALYGEMQGRQEAEKSLTEKMINQMKMKGMQEEQIQAEFERKKAMENQPLEQLKRAFEMKQLQPGGPLEQMDQGKIEANRLSRLQTQNEIDMNPLDRQAKEATIKNAAQNAAATALKMEEEEAGRPYWGPIQKAKLDAERALVNQRDKSAAASGRSGSGEGLQNIIRQDRVAKLNEANKIIEEVGSLIQSGATRDDPAVKTRLNRLSLIQRGELIKESPQSLLTPEEQKEKILAPIIRIRAQVKEDEDRITASNEKRAEKVALANIIKGRDESIGGGEAEDMSPFFDYIKTNKLEATYQKELARVSKEVSGTLWKGPTYEPDVAAKIAAVRTVLPRVMTEPGTLKKYERLISEGKL